MSQDLEEYQHIIEQLKSLVNEPEFNQVLNQIAAHVPKEKRFLIKMELKRLARPCIRLIDLRGQVDGECRLFEYDEKSHYLDDVAIEVFERQVRLFGEYTIGVYEAVMNTENNFRVMFKKQSEKIDQEAQEAVDDNRDPLDDYRVPVVELNDFASRSEERMNYAVAIEVFVANNKSLQASTIDMSVNGLRIKAAKDYAFKMGEKLTIHFRGLEGEFTIDKKAGVGYTVVHIEKGDKEQKLALQRSDDEPVSAFDEFLEKFIHGNKRRYKVNMDNTLYAIQNKTYEQYFTPTFPSVPVFIEEVDGVLQPRYIMSNDCNKETIYYWSDEQYELRIGYLFSHSRLSYLASLAKGQRETFIYAFNHVKDEKVYFYSASMEELREDPSLLQLFLGFGSRKASWRVYKVQLTDVLPDQAHVPLSIPDSVSDTVRRQNQPPAPRLMARLKHMRYICLLTDVTDSVTLAPYQAMRIRRDELANLRVFGHPRNKPPAAVSMYRFKYLDLRRETRYQLRSKIIVKCDDMELTGVSEDISVNGLRVELDTYFHLPVNTKVELSFPQLQKVTKKYDLSSLAYRVKNLSKDNTVMHLAAVHSEENQTTQRFFDELIRNNRSRLKAFKDEEEIPGIGTALRNLYANNQLNLALFIKKDGISFLPEAVTTTEHRGRLANLLRYDAEPKQFNLRLLYQHGKKQRTFIADCMRMLKTNQKPLMREVFVCFDPSQRDFEDAVNSEFAEHFKSDRLRKNFISASMVKGQFLALKVFVARSGRPDSETLMPEINYVSVYAVHRAKMLEEHIWSIAGVSNILDVTDEVMLRYGFTAEQIEKNWKPPESLKVDMNVEQLLKA